MKMSHHGSLFTFASHPCKCTAGPITSITCFEKETLWLTRQLLWFGLKMLFKLVYGVLSLESDEPRPCLIVAVLSTKPPRSDCNQTIKTYETETTELSQWTIIKTSLETLTGFCKNTPPCTLCVCLCVCVCVSVSVHLKSLRYNYIFIFCLSLYPSLKWP